MTDHEAKADELLRELAGDFTIVGGPVVRRRPRKLAVDETGVGPGTLAAVRKQEEGVTVPQWALVTLLGVLLFGTIVGLVMVLTQGDTHGW